MLLLSHSAIGERIVCRLLCNYVAISVIGHCSIVVSVSGYAHSYRYILCIIKAYFTGDLLRIKLRIRHVCRATSKVCAYDLRPQHTCALLCVFNLSC